MTPENIAGMAYLNRLDAIALTDHNTCRNCEALLRAAEKYDIFAICGMELTTVEEVHVLCLFPTLENAMDFDAYVRAHQQAIPNRPAFFGEQLLFAPGDVPRGSFEPLLITATDISFFSLPDLLTRFSGIHIPAHIEKTGDSLLSNLGFVPEDSRFSCYEINHPEQNRTMQKAHPYLSGCAYICDSDAHMLHQIKDADSIYRLDVSSLSFEGIAAALMPA